MLRRLLCVLASVLGATGAAAATDNYYCQYRSGEDLFKGAHTLNVQRNDKSVVVRGVSAGLPIGEDDWTYEVVASDKTLGFRAIRMPLPRSHLDVLVGGELFLLLDDGRLKLVVVGTNAAAAISAIATFVCVKAT